MTEFHLPLFLSLMAIVCLAIAAGIVWVVV